MKALVVRFIRRSVAYLVDSFLVFLFIRPELFARVWFGAIDTLWAALLDLLTIVLTAIYIVGCHWRWGRTVGKKVMGLRVATLGGLSPPGFRAALVRFSPLLIIGIALYAIDWFVLPYWDGGRLQIGQERIGVWQVVPLIWLLLDIGFALRTEGYRSLHDLFAGTVVTDESAKKKA